MMSSTPEFQLRSPTVLVGLLCASPVWGEEYYFNPALFQGAAYGQNISQFNQQHIPVGQYLVDVFFNNTLVKSGVKVQFRAQSGTTHAEPCLPVSLMKAAQVKSLPADLDDDECRPLTIWVPQANWEFEISTLRLQLNIPMTELERTPRGYIPSSEWDRGTTALFLRHNTSYTVTENTNSSYRYQYLWSGTNVGTNFDLWQVRHQGNLRYVDSNQGGAYRYNSVRTWIQRPFEQIDSIMTFGNSHTDSSLFGSLAFNGIKLVTDERMWPQGRRGYAPEVRGVAESSARVVVKQLSKVIYEINVPPGPFVIDDLYNTSDQGDLEVDVISVSGKIASFTVPYSAVPDSVRPGNWHYSAALGRVRQYYSVENSFFEGSLQHGSSNNLTANVGSRFAENYQAWLAGGVWDSSLGAFGMNATWSSARVENDDRQRGWRAEFSYSETFTSGTHLVLAAYRYSTDGFRDLEDVLGVRLEQKTGADYYSDMLRQRNRLSATVSQRLGDFGSLNMSVSTADYYSNQSRITQLQQGYSNQWQRISYGINIARQRTSRDYGRFHSSMNDLQDSSRRQKYTENTFSFNASIPLYWGDNRTSLAMNYNQSRQSRSSMLSMAGTAGGNSDLSWSMYGGYERLRNSSSGTPVSFGGSLQQNTRIGALRSSYNQGENYRQGALGASGTVVIHPGGVTFGPYTSDTFALIHAEGAQGAIVQNGQGAVIDSFGYAIFPSLSPYNANNITLDTRKMHSDTELTGGSQRIVPYAGAVARVNFVTVTGKAVLINLKSVNGSVPPMGAEVVNCDGTVIGMVGQGGQIYARIGNPSGSLLVRWGVSQRCRVTYQIDMRSTDDLIHLNKTCKKE